MPFQSLSRVRGLIMWRQPTRHAARSVMVLLASSRELTQHAYIRASMRDQSTWKLTYLFGLFVFAGCAAYTPPPLTMQHPAHPEATAAPELPPSTTLAYTTADIPSPRPAVPVAQRGRQGASPSEPKGAQTAVGEGKVIAVVPGSQEIVVNHGDINGFMGPMTMGYSVAPPSLLEGLQAGDTVRFTIDTEQKAIVKLEKLKP